MNLLLLAGNNYHNKRWIHNLGDELAPLFNKCLVHDYEHWHNDSKPIDLNLELDVLSKDIAALDEYSIFAKSIGGVLAFLGISRGILKPNKCIIAGLPLYSIERHESSFDVWLSNNKTPLLVIQNANDPTGSFEDVKKYLTEIKGESNFEIVELPGNNHDYDNIQKLKEITKSFLAN